MNTHYRMTRQVRLRLLILCVSVLALFAQAPVALPFGFNMLGNGHAQTIDACVLDLAIVLDGSGSVSATDFQFEKDFAKGIVDNLPLGDGSVQVSVVQFSGFARVEVPLSGDASAVNTGIDNITQIDGSTDFQDAIQTAQQELSDNGRPGVARAIILQTDGDASVPSAANEAKAAGTKIFGVAVGPGAILTTINEIASDPDSDFVFIADDFDELTNIIFSLNQNGCGIAGEISGQIFDDANLNGVQDAGEGAADNFTVELVFASDASTAIATTTTDTNGNYSFFVADGTYRVRLPAGSETAGSSSFNNRLSTPITISGGNTVTGIDTGVQVSTPTVPISSGTDDFYSTETDVAITVSAADGVLANDSGANSLTQTSSPANGSLTLNPNGSFTYTPNGGFRGVDTFTYDSSGPGVNYTNTVSISVLDLVVAVPGTQNTPANTPIPIPDVTVDSDATPPDVTVELSVSDGTLDVNTTVVNLPQNNNNRRTMSRPGSTFMFQGVAVTGSGTNNVTLSGREADVNVVLATLTYTPNRDFVGVDNLIVVANDATTTGIAPAQAQVVINVTAISGGGGGNNGGGGGDQDNDDDDDDNEIEGTSGIPGTSGFVLDPNDVPGLAPGTNLQTLNAISLLPGTVIRGLAPPNTVTNGDVIVQIIVANGDFVGSEAEIGDMTLLQRGVLNAAELIGFTTTGGSTASFNNRIKVCLLGNGAIFYRDGTGQPRQTVELPTFLEGNFTCAFIPNGGTFILVQGASSLQPGTDNTAGGADTTAANPTGRVELTNCMAYVRNLMNLREGPSLDSPVITQIPFDVTLTAIAREGDWLELDYLGTFGYASEAFLDLEGNCGG